jgi:hypothetical protein
MEHVILGLLVVIEASIGWYFLSRYHRDAREHHQARVHHQDHIAALVADVLRRPRP